MSQIEIKTPLGYEIKLPVYQLIIIISIATTIAFSVFISIINYTVPIYNSYLYKVQMEEYNKCKEGVPENECNIEENIERRRGDNSDFAALNNISLNSTKIPLGGDWFIYTNGISPLDNGTFDIKFSISKKRPQEKDYYVWNGDFSGDWREHMDDIILENCFIEYGFDKLKIDKANFYYKVHECKLGIKWLIDKIL